MDLLKQVGAVIYLQSSNQTRYGVVRGNCGLLTCGYLLRRDDGSVLDLAFQIAHFLIEELPLAPARNVEHHELSRKKEALL